MAKQTWDAVVRNALYYHLHKDRFAYLYGCKGATITSRAQFNDYVNREPKYFAKYSKQELDAIYNYCLGKTCFDCSGFIAAITGCHMYSGAQWEKCTSKSSDLRMGPAGSILHLPGHIGIDIGYGYYLHFPSEMHSCELGRISENTTKWTETGLLTPYIDYTGASER